MNEDRPRRATVLHERDHDPLTNIVQNATADTSILLHCPGCDELINLGPRTGHYELNLPWLASLCPICGVRFRVVQRIDITWQPSGGAE